MKKYIFTYVSAPTGFYREEEFDTIKQVLRDLDIYKYENTAKVTVYDRILNDFIYYKDAYENNIAEIDLIYSRKRDLRTVTRKEKKRKCG